MIIEQTRRLPDECSFIGSGQDRDGSACSLHRRSLCKRDPSLLAAFRESTELLYRVFDDRGDREAAAMVSAFAER